MCLTNVCFANEKKIVCFDYYLLWNFTIYILKHTSSKKDMRVICAINSIVTELIHLE